MAGERRAYGQTDRAPNGAPLPPAEAQARALLPRLAHGWGRRAEAHTGLGTHAGSTNPGHRGATMLTAEPCFLSLFPPRGLAGEHR
jgi:hypothetical protein